MTVNGIAPAYVRTPMVTEELTEGQRQALLAMIPVGRFCEPEEFAHVVRFLASPLAGFITGEIIDVKASIDHIDALSAHADRSELVRWTDTMGKRAPRRVFITHGEPESAESIAALYRERHGWDVRVPAHLEKAALYDG